MKELLVEKCLPKDADRLAQLLSEGTWTHGYPITYEKVKRLGLCVLLDIPEEILQPMSLFPQPIWRQPGFEYLPVPRRFERPGSREEGEWLASDI